ncbi:ABC transporter permease [Alkalicoccus urumqiensis]|uniref:ABC transporter permease n=2 Tax=Alkalicoccus urumqiensis TaxID=1548213 RepID=A0A2P6MK55_ALKUR|nr:ABC transporter permease [Alkalicoccus urumqiensis]
MMLFVGQGMFRAVQESLAFGGAEGMLVHYETLFASRSFWAAAGVSVYVALVSSIVSLVIGLVITRTFVRVFAVDTWKLAAWFPMLIPHFVAAYLVLLFFAPAGWAASVLGTMLPPFVQSSAYTGVILTYIWKEVPFVILMLLPVYQELDWRMAEVSRSLGAGRFQTFRHAEWPHAGPVAVETALIMFIFILGAFEIPGLLGVTYPAMLPVLAFDWFYQSGWSERPLAQAMMVLVTAVSLVLAALVLSWVRRGRRRSYA